MTLPLPREWWMKKFVNKLMDQQTQGLLMTFLIKCSVSRVGLICIVKSWCYFLYVSSDSLFSFLSDWIGYRPRCQLSQEAKWWHCHLSQFSPDKSPGNNPSPLWDSMDGTGEHDAKWSKPGGDLINKINKQAKYNQRHWNKEQTDSNQRGGGREITGKEWKVSSKNMYKGARDKAKGGKDWGWELGVGGTEESSGREMETTIFKQQ